MKLLAFVDMHGSHKALEKIKAQSKQSDILVCAGDISIFENNLDKLFFELNKLNKPVLIIPGNHESTESINVLTKLFPNIINIDEKGHAIGNYLFFGYGGGGFSMVDMGNNGDVSDFHIFSIKRKNCYSSRNIYLLL